MRAVLTLRSRLAPARTAHAWWDGEGAGGGASGGAPTPPGAGDPPPAGGAPTPPGAGDPPPAGDGKPKESPELIAARRENARIAAQLKKLQEEAEARANAELSDTERLKKALAEREQELAQERSSAKAQRLAMDALAAAGRLGFADPEDAQRFLDQDAIEWSEDGRPKNVQALLQAVLERKPYLKASHQQPPDLGQGARGRTTLTREQIARMTPAEVNARWPEVQQVLARTKGS